jgi:non-ribosomal peptide synthetase component F
MMFPVNQVSVFDEYVLHPLLEKIEKNGSSNSFRINEIFYSYQDFSHSVSKIRDSLQQHYNVSTNIGLIANDDLETYASIFAIWLEGYSYVPLHPNQPVERILDIISQADIELIIDSCGKAFSNDIPTINSSHLLFKNLNLNPVTTPDSSLAYILFTSGSTGVPKGVPITRGNTGSFMKSFWEAGFDIDHNDRCLQCFDLTFDVSVQSFLVPLTKGACTYTIPHDQIKYS